MAEEMNKEMDMEQNMEQDMEQDSAQCEPESGEPGEEASEQQSGQEQEPQSEPKGEEGESDAPAEASEEPEKEPEKSQGKGKKDGFFKKKKDKRDEQIEELQDKLRRQMAEFENFRKRTDREKSQMFDMGARTIVEKMLPVVDNFERGLAAVPEEQKEDPFVTGMDKVYKQLMTEFEAIGVAAIEAVGKEFDPELHNAVMQVEDEEKESGTVAAELQKGYRYKDTVVRHSMVSVVS